MSQLTIPTKVVGEMTELVENYGGSYKFFREPQDQAETVVMEIIQLLFEEIQRQHQAKPK